MDQLSFAWRPAHSFYQGMESDDDSEVLQLEFIINGVPLMEWLGLESDWDLSSITQDGFIPPNPDECPKRKNGPDEYKAFQERLRQFRRVQLYKEDPFADINWGYVITASMYRKEDSITWCDIYPRNFGDPECFEVPYIMEGHDPSDWSSLMVLKFDINDYCRQVHELFEKYSYVSPANSELSWVGYCTLNKVLKQGGEIL